MRHLGHRRPRQFTKLDAITVSNLLTHPAWSYLDGILRFGVEDNTWEARSCTLFRRQLNFDLDSRRLSRLRLRYAAYDDWIVIRLNGRPVHYGPDYLMNTLEIDGNHVIFFRDPAGQVYRNRCDLRRNWEEELYVDLSRYAQSNQNTLEIDVAVRGGGEGYVEIEMLAELQQTWTEQCDPGFSPAGRSPSSTQCSDRGDRRFGGASVSLPCWRWLDTYEVVLPPRFAEGISCGQLRERGCTQTDATCMDMTAQGYCARQRSTFECFADADAASQVDVCAEVLACPNGDCAAEYQETHDATADFQQAASALSVTMETARGLDPDTLGVFVGQAKSCHNAALGFASCCRGSGWGVDLRLARCTSQEKELGIARQSARAHYVGRYSSGTLGRTKRRVYCVYPSQLVRMVIGQGKAQLGAGFGSAREPDCSGFTQQELEALDFDAMDFSELHDDMLAAAEGGPVPDPEQLAEELRGKITRMGGAR